MAIQGDIMTTETTGQSDQDSGQDQEIKPEINVNELMGRLDKLESYNEKLLSETKQWRTKFKSLRTETDEKETESLQKENDFKGLYEKSNNKLMEMQQQINDEKKSSVKSAFKYEVAKLAPDAQDSDALVHMLNSKTEIIGFDKELNRFVGIDDAIAEIRTEKSWMFKTDKPGMVTGRPQKVKEKTINELMDEDASGVLNSAIANLLK